MAPVVQLGVQEVYVVEEPFHCDGPEQKQADRQVGGSEQEQADRQVGGSEQEQADKQFGVIIIGLLNLNRDPMVFRLL